ncbi:FAD/NAD(P)-binding domain-containing protein [Pluteus cervinus]|uniref:FAD/NAD(P)-binding domain-containing protein n=1 Tax=Pluteus cervinus TaxID=181527 RepID=A0ACD3AL57_9AGAR|nr:FAD/NAD(P)-binding domain-containing protein [Pluteus cervinus]
MSSSDLRPDIFSYYARNLIKDFQNQFALPVAETPGPAIPNLPPGQGVPDVPFPTPDLSLGVGIIGGGVGGLYAAMILQSMKIKYEILEATDDIGGRLYTYHFDKSKPPGGHEYFDVGAMRFPDTPMMRRTFKLFDDLGSRISRIPYFFNSESSTLLYNGIPKKNGTPFFPKTWEQPFPEPLPEKYHGMTSSDLSNYAVKPFADALAKDIALGQDPEDTPGWKLLMKYDKYSTRAYMLLEPPQDPELKKQLDPKNLFPYPSYLIDFCEDFSNSTGSFDTAFTEKVLSYLNFNWKDPTDPTKVVQWCCLDGGSQTLAYAMRDCLKEKVVTGFRVGSIALSNDKKLEVKSTENVTKTYDYVITTTSLPCLRVMDLDGAALSIAQRIALRQLQYDPSTKIGIQFKTQWWTNKNPKVTMPYGPIHGGQSTTDRNVRTVVYPSYGEKTGTPSRVLMVNYAWANDAVRLTGLISSGDADALKLLKDLVLRDLVAMHEFVDEDGDTQKTVTYEFLQDQFVAWYPFSWVTASNTIGAFAHFAPGQFKQTYGHLTLPAAEGRLYFAGEALSTRHGWVAGALSASWRAIHQALCVVGEKGKLQEFYQTWGKDEDWGTDEDEEDRDGPSTGGGRDDQKEKVTGRERVLAHLRLSLYPLKLKTV